MVLEEAEPNTQRKGAKDRKASEGLSSYVRILMLMNTQRQRLMRGFTCLAILNGLTSAALGICLLLGPGFQVSNLMGDLSSPKSGSYFQQSYQSDSAVSRIERHVTASDKSPRRQPSFGALPNAVEHAVCNVTIERTRADLRRDSLTAASDQHDRAPPS
ncbi:MAG TPA: hypothetical protein VN937_30235 [Blastocatellia bacterium]|nr:hypothetical protein [Blastocatellia bacterium]